jgi:UDP-GlcNAc:undecaprenyl-phosphate GlcNAc-1-phosphate transferase
VVLMVISACCGLTVLGVLLGVALKNEWIALVAASTVVLLLLVTGLFGRAELLLVQKRCGGLVHSLWRRDPYGRGKELEVRLEGSADWHREIWEPLLECAVQLQLKTVHFNVNAPAIHEGWHGEWSCAVALTGDESALWRAHVPILVAERVVGSLEIAGWQGPEPVWEKIKVLGVVLQKVEALILDLSASERSVAAVGHDRFHSPELAVPHHAQAFGPSPEVATSPHHSAEDHCPVAARPQTNGAVS